MIRTVMLKTMRMGPFLRSIRISFSLLCLFAFALAAVRAQSPAITLTPAVVLAGAPELIRVSAPGAASLDGEWLGRKLEFFRGSRSNSWFALAGVDVDASVGLSVLKITVHDAKGGTRPLSRTVPVHSGHYRTSALTVAPEFVQPGPKELKQIADDQLLTEKAYASSAPRPLWTGNFRAPVVAPQTERFGTGPSAGRAHISTPPNYCTSTSARCASVIAAFSSRSALYALYTNDPMYQPSIYLYGVSPVV